MRDKVGAVPVTVLGIPLEGVLTSSEFHDMGFPSIICFPPSLGLVLGTIEMIGSSFDNLLGMTNSLGTLLG